ncbi:MAG TPA: MlaD family protein, partial [Planctomycetota bacterium]|nr:MlaD family protein [Planctomycetota bacterium]
HAYLPSASGLVPGARVYLSGVAVGTVERIDFSEDLSHNAVRLSLRIDEAAAQRIREDSRLWLQTEGLLGDYSVRVSMGTATKPWLGPGSEIPVEDMTLLDAVAGKQISTNTAALMQSMLEILGQIQRGEGTLGQLVRNPSLYDELTSVLGTFRTLGARLETVATEIEGAVRTVKSGENFAGKLLFTREHDETLAHWLERIDRIVDDVAAISTSVREGRGALGKVVNDPTLYKTTLETMERVSSLAGVVDGVLETARDRKSVLGRVLADQALGEDVTALVASLESSARSLERILSTIERGEGSVGMLVHDPSIATAIRNVVLGVQDLGYVRSLVTNAETIGMEVIRRRRLAMAERDEAGRVGAIVRGTADSGSPAAVPAAGSDESARESSPTGAAARADATSARADSPREGG